MGEDTWVGRPAGGGALSQCLLHDIIILAVDEITTVSSVSGVSLCPNKLTWLSDESFGVINRLI